MFLRQNLCCSSANIKQNLYKLLQSLSLTKYKVYKFWGIGTRTIKDYWLELYTKVSETLP